MIRTRGKRFLPVLAAVALLVAGPVVVGTQGASAAATKASKPGAPGRPVAVKIASRQVILTWSRPKANGSKVTSYRVTHNGVVVKTCKASRCLVSGLENGRSYRFRVAAHNAKGWGPAGPSSSLVTLPSPGTHVPATPAAPEAPGAPVAKATGGSGVLKLTWSAVPTPPGATVLYQVKLPDGSESPASAKLDYTADGLSDGVRYTFRIRATTSGGPSAWSPASTPAFAFDSRSIGTPDVISARPSEGGHSEFYGGFSLNWCPPASHPEWIDHYEFSVNGGSWDHTKIGPAPSWLGLDSACRSASDDIPDFGTYTLAVRAVDLLGHPGSAATTSYVVPRTTIELHTSVVAATSGCPATCYQVTGTRYHHYYPEFANATVKVTSPGGSTRTCTVYAGGSYPGTSNAPNADVLPLGSSDCFVTSGDVISSAVGAWWAASTFTYGPYTVP